MTFQMVAYEKLRSSINQSIVTLLKHHKINSVDKLQDEMRRDQVQYLQKTIDLLEESPDKLDEDKALVLNAASYYVYMQIKDSYDKSKLSFLYNKSNSDFCVSLYTSLNLREKGNIPDNNDTFKLYNSLLTFMKLHMYHPDGLQKGFLLELSFSVPELKVLTIKVQALEFKLLDAALVLRKKQLLDMGKSGVKSEKPSNKNNFIVNNYIDDYMASSLNGEKSAGEIGLEKKDELYNTLEVKEDLSENNINISESQSCVSSLSSLS